MKPIETSLAKLIGQFFASHLTSERGASPHTIRSYAATLESFIEYIETIKSASKKNTLMTSVLTKDNVLDFLAWLESERGISVQTRNQRLAALHSFCRYLRRTDVIHIDRWEEILSIKAKKARSKPMSYLSVEGIKLLLEQIPTNTVPGRRNLAMIALLYDTAARVQELILLRPCDIHFESPAYLVLQGKGSKNRAVPLQEKQIALLRHYMNDNDMFRPESNTEPLFKNRDGEQLTGAGITYLLMKYVKLAHEKRPDLVPKKLSPHCLRHSKAMHMLQAGVSLIYIRDILGHASEVTTEIYARADSKQKREALEAAYKDVIPQCSVVEKPSWESSASLRAWLKSLGKH